MSGTVNFRQKALAACLILALASNAGIAERKIQPPYLNPQETARALVLMTERYLLDAFGKPTERPTGSKKAAVVCTLEEVWVRTLYGRDD